MDFSSVEIWSILAGLGLFIFGMYLLEDSLKGLVGRSFKKFLRNYTKHPVQAVISGTAVTAVLQSSGMVILLVMSLAGAGVIGLEHGIGMIMGANLGTTITGWIVSLLGFKLNIEALILPILSISGMGVVFIKNKRFKFLFRLLLGFSFMFLGLDYMKNGFTEFAAHADLSFLQGKHPALFVLTGAFLAAAIQSSSGAMIIYLSSLAAGVITIDQGYYLVIGSDIGTTITALIGTIGGNSIRKKVGWSQFTFNIITGIIGLSMIGVLNWFITEQLSIKDPTIALVSFHSIFNLLGIIIMLPFLKLFTRFINKIIIVRENKRAKSLMFVNPADTNTAIEALNKEAEIFLKKTIEINASYFDHQEFESLPSGDGYAELKLHEAEIVDFYMKILQQVLSEEEVKKVNHLIDVFRNATLSSKDLKDIRHNLDEIKNTASDHLYDFYKELSENQSRFYREIRTVLDSKSALNINELHRLDNLQQISYRKESEELNKAFSESSHRDIDMPSLMNMLREVNNSNEYFLRAIEQTIVLDQGSNNP